MKNLKFIGYILLTLACTLSYAKTPEEIGLDIAIETDRRDQGFTDSTADMIMILKNQDGDESIRTVKMKSLEMDEDCNKDLSIFQQPSDLKNTAVLTYSHALNPDEQWIYLPGLKRVKRISTRNKSGPFVGSEFAFEDLSSWEVDKYSYRFIKDDMLDERDCFMVENTPRYEYSGYTRQIEWVDKDIYHPRRIDYYDRQNKLLKTLTFHDYQQYLGHYWRPDRMLMINHQTGKSTELLWSDRQFQVGLTERDFIPGTLKR
jgi:hypothetical protein